MNHKHLLHLLRTDYTTIRCVFNDNGFDSKAYTYKAPLGVQEGDFVVVDSPSKGLTVVRVDGVDAAPRIDLEAKFTYKWIVSTIDRSHYDGTLRAEAEFTERLEEVEAVLQREQELQRFTDRLTSSERAMALYSAAATQYEESLRTLKGE